jgi:hypothetical protein
MPVLVLLGVCSAMAIAHNHQAGGHALCWLCQHRAWALDFLDVLDESQGVFVGLDKKRVRSISKLDEKMDRFIRLLTNADDLRPRRRAMLMEEAETTADFPILFGTVLERTLLARYKTATSDWRTYIKTGTQNDFRQNNIIGVYGLESPMSVVAERGEYKSDSLSDGKVANQLFKYGRQFPLSWEALINDDLGAFSDVAQRLANAALVTEYIQSTKLFCEATGPISSLYSTSGLAHKIDGAASSILPPHHSALTLLLMPSRPHASRRTSMAIPSSLTAFIWSLALTWKSLFCARCHLEA